MSCAGYFFQHLLREAEEEPNKKEHTRLEEMEKKLKQRVQNLQVQGDFHKVNRVKKITERMKQFLEG